MILSLQGWGRGHIFVEFMWQQMSLRAAKFSGLVLEPCVHLALDATVPPPSLPPPSPPAGLGSPGHRAQVPGYTLNTAH